MKNDVNFTVNKDKCIKCGLCEKDCPVNIIKLNEYPEIDTSKTACLRCQHCYAICPTGAISILGNTPDGNSTAIDINPEEIKKLMQMRRTTRQYKDENIDKSLINNLVKTALHAPTTGNLMTTHFSVIDDKEVLSRFKNKVYDKLSSLETPQFEFLKSFMESWNNDRKDRLFLGAPHLIVASELNDSIAGVTDSIISLSYFDILANSYKVGTTWDGVLTVVLTSIFPELKQDLHIPENYKIVYAMLFGNPSIKYKRIVKKDPMNINIVN